MKKWYVYIVVLLCACPLAASAENKTKLVLNGAGGGKLALGPEQKLMFQATNKFVQLDYKGAETLYTQAIAMNGNNANAYVQRGAVRRELHNTAGMKSDAERAIVLLNANLEQNTNNADLYYQRSLAHRLLKQFDAAEQDLQKAMQIANRAEWETDMKAIALERKMAQ